MKVNQFIRVTVSLAFLATAITLAFRHVIFIQIYQVRTDFRAHANFAIEGVLGTHPLLPTLTNWLANTFAVAHVQAVCVISIIAFIASSMITAWRLDWEASKRNYKTASTTILWTLMLVFCNPIFIFTVFLPNVYFGYRFINVFHNPTILLCQPFSYGLFWLFTRLSRADSESKTRATTVLLVVALSALSTLAKPSFALCFIPAVVITFLVERFYLRTQRRSQLIAACSAAIIPATVILGIQLSFYPSSSEDSRMAFSWLGMLRDPVYVACFKWLMSLAFPAIVLAMFPKRCLASNEFRLSLIMYVVAFATYLCFIEAGPRRLHGNFGWGTVIAGYILFTEAACVLRSQLSSENFITPSSREHTLKLIACFAVFSAHITCGIGYIRLHFREATDVAWFW